MADMQFGAFDDVRPEITSLTNFATSIPGYCSIVSLGISWTFWR